MANKHQLRLHELLKEDQEPFHLTNFISDRRSLFRKTVPTKTLQLKKQRPIVPEATFKSGRLCRRACFLSFTNSPDVSKSPFPDFHSPAAMSPCKNGAFFLHVPSKTAAHLAEAAMRIQKPKLSGKSVGFGLLGSFLKRLKERSKSKKCVIGDSDIRVFEKQGELGEIVRISNVEKSEDLHRASTSSCCSSECEFELWETRFCVSPFSFSFHQSPLTTGRHTPDFCSPMASPGHTVVKKGQENSEIQSSDHNVQGGEEEEEEEKDQCSPVSVLDPPFEDDEHDSGDAEEESCDLECSYGNLQRAREQLLYRLRRFEKLAELDPIELERKFLEGSSDNEEDQGEFEDDTDESLLVYTNRNIETIVTKAFNQSNLQNHYMKSSTDPTTGAKNDVMCLGNKKVILGRICKRLDFSKEVEFETIDLMIELDFKNDLDGWKKFEQEEEETVDEFELAIFGILVEELSEELSYMDPHDIVL